MSRPHTTVWLSIILGLTLAVLIGWEIHLIEDHVETEHKKSAWEIDQAATSFGEALEFELTRAFEHFQIDYENPTHYREQIEERFKAWPEHFPYIHAMPRVVLVSRDDQTLQMLELRPNQAPAPAAPLAQSEPSLERRFAESAVPSRAARFPLYLADPIGTVGPLFKFRFRTPPTPQQLAAVDLPFPATLVVLFDRTFIERQLVPELERRWLQTERGTMRHQLRYSADGRLSEDESAADARRTLWMTGSWRAVPFGGAHEETAFFPPRSKEFPEPDRWILSVSHPSGSLANADRELRWSEYPVGLVMILALGAASACAVWMAHRAQGAARQQLEFVAAVTHELNTPITAIRGAAQNLTDRVVEGPHQVQLYGRMIESACDRLASMVGQVLKYASIDNAPIAVHRVSTPLEPVLRSVIDSVAKLANDEAVAIELRSDSAMPTISTDPEGLSVILRNLIENAIKHGRSGGWVGVEVRQAAGGSTSISVADRGQGIAPEHRERIFEPFFRIPGGVADRPLSGSGLGLCIAKRLASKLGAELRCEENAHQGARFTLTFPPAGVNSERIANDAHKSIAADRT